MGQYLHQLSLVQSSRSIQRMQTVPLPKQVFGQFLGRTSLGFTDQETQEENMLMDQLPCGSVLTPAISCTKFKIHSAHADSPKAKTGFSVYFLGRTSLCFTDQETQEENVLGGPTPLWVSTYTSYLLYKVQDPFSACRQSHSQNRFAVHFLGRISLCLTDQETQEENVLGGPTPLWVSTYTSYLLYKFKDPFSVCRQSHCENMEREKLTLVEPIHLQAN